MNIALLWGGLRGALTLALVLAVSETAGIDPQTRHVIGVIATGYTLFTLIVQGTTLRIVVRTLGLSKLSSVERAFRGQALSSTVERTHERVRAFARRAGIQDTLVNDVMATYQARIEGVSQTSTFETEISDIEKIRLGLAALVSQERNLLLEQRWSSGLPSSMVDQYLYTLDRMRDEAREKGRVGYLRAARAPYQSRKQLRLATFLHNTLGLQVYLASYLGRRFHYLLVNRVMVMQLRWYSESRLQPIFGERITDILLEYLSRRQEDVEKRLDAIRLQYPEFASALETSMVSRYAHQEEMSQIRDLADSGVIAAEIAISLTDEAENTHRRLRRPGRVDIEQPKPDLLRSLRAFEAFSDKQLVHASRRMRSVVFPADTTIYKPGDQVDFIYFIASGAVEVERLGDAGKIRLGRGQAFGQIRFLNPGMKAATVRTISYSHCFRMRIRDFRQLTREAPSWKFGLSNAAPERISSRKT